MADFTAVIRIEPSDVQALSPRDATAYHLRAQAYADKNENKLALADLDVVDQLGGDRLPKK